MKPLDVFKSKCDIERITFDGSKYGTDNKNCYFHRIKPKGYNDSNGAAILYYHGSAFLFFNADMF